MYLSLEFIPIRDSEIRGINTSESCTCYFFVKRIGSSLPFDAHWEVIIVSGTTLFLCPQQLNVCSQNSF